MSKVPHSRVFANQVRELVGGKLTQMDRKIFLLGDDLEIIESFERPYDAASLYEITSRRDELTRSGELRAIVHLRVFDEPFLTISVVEDFEDHDPDTATIHYLATGVRHVTRWIEIDMELMAGFIAYWYEKGGK